MLAAALTLLLAAEPPPAVGQIRWRGSELDPAQRTMYEQHFRAALRRYGLPVDTADATEARLGATLVEQCADDWTRCGLARGMYRALVVGQIWPAGSGFRAHYGIVSTASGALVASEEIEAPDPRQFLDAEIGLAQRMARKSAAELGLELPVDAPLRGAAVYPFIGGTVLVGAGTYFLVAASSASNTLKNPASPLDEATGARNSGSRDLVLGATLTGLGLASLVVGIVFYAPGAENKPLARFEVDPVGQRVAVTGVLP